MINWVRYLKISARSADKVLFNGWCEGQYTTDQTITNMKKNNKMPQYITIDREDFIRWLGSLGYRRRVNVER